jgi:hypothetical protein
LEITLAFLHSWTQQIATQLLAQAVIYSQTRFVITGSNGSYISKAPPPRPISQWCLYKCISRCRSQHENWVGFGAIERERNFDIHVSQHASLFQALTGEGVKIPPRLQYMAQEDHSRYRQWSSDYLEMLKNRDAALGASIAHLREEHVFPLFVVAAVRGKDAQAMLIVYDTSNTASRNISLIEGLQVKFAISFIVGIGYLCSLL